MRGFDFNPVDALKVTVLTQLPEISEEQPSLANSDCTGTFDV